MRYEPYDWADVEEPTAEELAEIEAAVPAEMGPTMSLTEWALQPTQQAAVAKVGPPDGSPDWIIAFAGELLSNWDSTQAFLRERRIDVDYYEYLRSEWTRATGRYRSGYTVRPQRIICELLHVGMSLKAAAQYLGTTPLALARHLSYANKVEGLVQADALLRCGSPSLADIARRTGLSRDAVAAHAKRCGIVPEQVARRHRGDGIKWPAAVKVRTLELHELGLNVREILDQLKGEFAACEIPPYDTVYSYIRRAPKAEAA